MKARAVLTNDTVERRDPIFGKVQRYENVQKWRVRIQIGANQFFTSDREYANEKSAQAAANRISKARGEQQ